VMLDYNWVIRGIILLQISEHETHESPREVGFSGAFFGLSRLDLVLLLVSVIQPVTEQRA
ncbi:hypothetical protein ACTRHB_002762, partial [Enterococcus faecium]